MPFFGLGIHILIALFFAVHAVRSGRELYWLVILFMFPVLGSIVYFFVVFLPHSRIDRGLRQAGASVARSLDPGRELREARAAFDLTPTAHNRMRLAQALFDAGQTAAAVAEFDACLAGPFAQDQEINFAAARAKLAHGQAAETVSLLEALRQRGPSFRPEQVGLLLAKAYAASGRQDEAGAELAAVTARFGSIEARAEYLLWAMERNEHAIVAKEMQELEHARRHMARYTQELYADLLRKVDAAYARFQRG